MRSGQQYPSNRYGNRGSQERHDPREYSFHTPSHSTEIVAGKRRHIIGQTGADRLERIMVAQKGA
jgi:hypothetical protein